MTVGLIEMIFFKLLVSYFLGNMRHYALDCLHTRFFQDSAKTVYAYIPELSGVLKGNLATG